MKEKWEIKKLGDVCEELFAGGDVPKDNSSKFETDKFQIPIFSNGEKNKGLYGFTNIARVTKPSITISARGTIGYSEIRYKSFFPAIRLIVVTPKTHIIELSFLKYVVDSVDFKHSGSSIPQLTVPMIKGYPIPLPSLTEQRHITTILDETFNAIHKAKTNAEQNLINAKELFESHLQQVFDNKGEHWEEKTLGEIAEVEYGYTDKSTEEGDYRYIRITDIDKNGELILEDKKYIKHSKEAKSFLIQDKDLLMARTGATFAKVLLYNGDEPSVFASYLIRIRFKEKIENALYWYFTKTKYYWDQANNLQSGAAQPHFNGVAVKQVVFSYPKSVSEQKKLIQKFEVLSVETKKLEAIYQKKIDDLKELKKSILQKAFAGELTSKELV